MRRRLTRIASLRTLTASVVLVAVGFLMPAGVGAQAASAATPSGGTVLQTNLVSDLPGVAAVTDPNLVNPWGISENAASPFWISDNNSGLSTLYSVPGAANTPVSVNSLVVNIPNPVGTTGGTPTGTAFNAGAGSGAFPVTGLNAAGMPATVPALFLFATEDGTIVGWNPAFGSQAALAVDKSGNNFTNPDPNQQTGAVYKGLTLATSMTPIIAGDANSTALLYVTNFRTASVEVYDSHFNQVTTLPAGAFTDPLLPAGYAPFNVAILNGKVYVDYARQDATKHDDLAGPHRGFVDVFNLDGTPGLPGGLTRLISGGALDSPWGLAIAPSGFAGLTAPGGDAVLLVGNFGDGHIDAFDATTGAPLGPLTDPDGEPIEIEGLWALQVGNGGAGGDPNTVYFTAGPFDESHGLFGSLETVAPGSPEGMSESQWVQARSDVVQLDIQQLRTDLANDAPPSTIRQDARTLRTDSHELLRARLELARDQRQDLRAG